MTIHLDIKDHVCLYMCVCTQNSYLQNTKFYIWPKCTPLLCYNSPDFASGMALNIGLCMKCSPHLFCLENTSFDLPTSPPL